MNAAEQEAETKKARALLKPCSNCQGYPILRYEPGSSYSTCVYLKNDCPCIERVPDFDPVGLAERINESR